jgi:hypothetical protein
VLPPLSSPQKNHHHTLIDATAVRYAEGDKVAMNVGFYYMANAMGRLTGEWQWGFCSQVGACVAQGRGLDQQRGADRVALAAPTAALVVHPNQSAGAACSPYPALCAVLHNQAAPGLQPPAAQQQPPPPSLRLGNAGTLASGALYTFTGATLVQGFGHCFLASTAFAAVSTLITTLIRDDKGGLACGACLQLVAPPRDTAEAASVAKIARPDSGISKGPVHSRSKAAATVVGAPAMVADVEQGLQLADDAPAQLVLALDSHPTQQAEQHQPSDPVQAAAPTLGPMERAAAAGAADEPAAGSGAAADSSEGVVPRLVQRFESQGDH